MNKKSDLVVLAFASSHTLCLCFNEEEQSFRWYYSFRIWIDPEGKTNLIDYLSRSHWPPIAPTLTLSAERLNDAWRQAEKELSDYEAQNRKQPENQMPLLPKDGTKNPS